MDSFSWLIKFDIRIKYTCIHKHTVSTQCQPLCCHLVNDCYHIIHSSDEHTHCPWLHNITLPTPVCCHCSSCSRAYLVSGNSLLKESKADFSIAYCFIWNLLSNLSKSCPSQSNQILSSNYLITIVVCGFHLWKLTEDAVFIKLLIRKNERPRTEKHSLWFRQFLHFLFSS